jgi:enoyl-CoA hydratase/carnithine racemase
LAGSVSVQRAADVSEITINNPDQRNALTPAMLATLSQTIADSERDGSTRVLVLRGGGDWFSSGYALDQSAGPGQNSFGSDVAQVCDALERSPLISIAMVRGFAVGAGLDVACACDFRFAERGAWFALPAVKLGLVYPWRGVRRLRRVLGPALVRRVLLGAERISTEEALASGVVAHAFDDEAALLEGTRAFAAELAGRSTVALSGMKRVLFELARNDELSGEVAAELEALTRTTMEGAELRAAAEKATKKPVGARGTK